MEAVQRLLKSCNSSTVAEAWSRIQARREADPEGAITAARALLESTCKHVLDELAVDYSHAHLLVGHVAHLSAKTIKACWSAGQSNVGRVRNGHRAAAYVTKAFAGHVVDFQLFGW
jgi:hypothetical protein